MGDVRRVDVTGLSFHHFVEVIALRPTPTSLTWLEYPGSLGKGVNTDWLLGDFIASSPDHAGMFSERLVLVPPPYLPSDLRDTVSTPAWVYEEVQETATIEICAHHHVWKLGRRLMEAIFRTAARQTGLLTQPQGS